MTLFLAFEGRHAYTMCDSHSIFYQSFLYRSLVVIVILLVPTMPTTSSKSNPIHVLVMQRSSAEDMLFKNRTQKRNSSGCLEGALCHTSL